MILDEVAEFVLEIMYKRDHFTPVKVIFLYKGNSYSLSFLSVSYFVYNI